MKTREGVSRNNGNGNYNRKTVRFMMYSLSLPMYIQRTAYHFTLLNLTQQRLLFCHFHPHHMGQCKA